MSKLGKAGPVLLSLSLGGCHVSGAATFEVVGAFFPAWLFCTVIGIAAAGAMRVVQVSSGRAELLAYPLLVSTAVGTIVGLLVWLVVFGR